LKILATPISQAIRKKKRITLCIRKHFLIYLWIDSVNLLDKQSKYFWSECVIKITFGWQKGAASFSWHQQSLFVVKTENLKIFFFLSLEQFSHLKTRQPFCHHLTSQDKKVKCHFSEIRFHESVCWLFWCKHNYYVFQHDMATLRKYNGFFSKKNPKFNQSC
jgi:hypothetical protein